MPRGPGSMREPWEMYAASRMQNMAQIRKSNAYSETNIAFSFFFVVFTFEALGVESPHGGAITDQ